MVEIIAHLLNILNLHGNLYPNISTSRVKFTRSLTQITPNSNVKLYYSLKIQDRKTLLFLKTIQSDQQTLNIISLYYSFEAYFD